LNITVNDPNQVENFMIINGSGQVIKTEQLSNRNNTVNISDLTNGIYIVKIAYKNNSYQMEKLIVK
ncbi:MAG: T9SS type A sorting domain-containing protein, partial [Bacteroidales bacterium]|nr:T9SS type A sorting domain-containing protein [Bacteroidales bacterium]